MATRDDSDTSAGRIVVCWRLFDRAGGCLVCELRRTADCLEVCCLHRNGDADRVESIDDARSGIILAGQWKASYLTEGVFFEEPPDQGGSEGSDAKSARRRTARDARVGTRAFHH